VTTGTPNRQGLKHISTQTLYGTFEEAAEKIKFLSFRGTLRAEESLLLLDLKAREIPHFVRNDNIPYFFRNL